MLIPPGKPCSANALCGPREGGQAGTFPFYAGPVEAARAWGSTPPVADNNRSARRPRSGVSPRPAPARLTRPVGRTPTDGVWKAGMRRRRLAPVVVEDCRLRSSGPHPHPALRAFLPQRSAGRIRKVRPAPLFSGLRSKRGHSRKGTCPNPSKTPLLTQLTFATSKTLIAQAPLGVLNSQDALPKVGYSGFESTGEQ